MLCYAGGMYVPCSPADPGAQEMTLQYFADNNLADKVVPPQITMRDFEKVRGGDRMCAQHTGQDVCATHR